MAKNISLLGADYPDVPAVVLPKTGGGSAMFVDADDVSNVESALAIVVNGNTAPKAITAGQYLFIKNHSTLATGGYHATANIASGGAVSESNVAADADGISNSINSNLNTVSSSTVTINTTNISSVNENSVERCGKLVILRMQFNFKTMPTVGTAVNVGTIPSGYCPKNAIETYGLGAGSAWKETDLASINIGVNGGISVTQRRTAQNNWVKFYIPYFI